MLPFHPAPPRTLDDTGVPPALLDQLLLKALYEVEGLTATQLARRLCMPLKPVMEALLALKQRKLVVHRSAALLADDYQYALSDQGYQRAELLRRRSAWSNAAPVPLDVWLDAIERQSARGREVVPMDILQALDDLLLSRTLLRQIGMAVATGKTLFLYGEPGNGKTSIAERITRAFGGGIYVPRLVLIDGQLVRVFDPKVHTPIEIDEPYDPRWVYCERPTVIVGGELRLDMLELQSNPYLGLAEAPVQLKAAGGTLVVDDLGRQRMEPAELLNRWIVPLDRSVDYLTLPDGTPIELPFDPFLVFSTNLPPASLADEAFLRRIPFKLQIVDPSPELYREILHIEAGRLGLSLPTEVEDALIASYGPDRPMRACHPRDLLGQVAARQRYLGRDLVVTHHALKDAMANYFVALP